MLGERLTAEQLAALKVRSGEHVGAIVATMLHFEAPIAVDEDGGPDLAFEPSDAWERPGVEVAYEIKSVAGDFREFDARSGDQGAPQKFSATFRTIGDIVGQQFDVVRAADERLAGKVSADSSRNVILVLHPFDGFPIEIADTLSGLLIGAGMSTSFAETGLDTVTLVVLPPGSIARWPRTLDRWESIVFASDPDNPEEDDESAIMSAETEFMARFRPGVESPYNVWITSSKGDDD